MDYRRQGVWDELADALETAFTPVPRGIYGHVECEPGWTWRFTMPEYDLWLVSAGHGTVVVSGQRIVVGPGSLLILRPGDVGFGTQDPDARLTVTYSHFGFVRPGMSEPVDVPDRWLPARHIQLEDLRAIHEPLLNVVRLRDLDDRFAAFRARVQLAQLLADAYRQDAIANGMGPRRIDPRVQEVMRHVRAHPSERPSLSEAAALAHVSPSHLRRLFAREVGISFRAFVLRSRMERARFLLGQSSMSVGEVSRALGYVDVALFSHQFRRHFGISPSRVARQE